MTADVALRQGTVERVAPAETALANPCALCGDLEIAHKFDVANAPIVRCLSCGLVRQLTRPVSASALYGSRYYVTDDPKGGYANYFLDVGINRKTFQRRLNAIGKRTGRCGRLLDVGCALGDFVLEAGRSGWDAEGVEISSFAAEQARKRGAKVMTGDLAELALPSESYDVVTLYDVIEHLFDPNVVLREIGRVLKPGGLLHIVTPNVGGTQARVLGRHWYHYKPGEHLYYFDPSTLRRLVEANSLGWDGWARSGSYVTFSYLFNRLRFYARQPFGALDWLGRTLRFGPYSFFLYVGEMEAWARKV